jgi:hypothetical protein
MQKFKMKVTKNMTKKNQILSAFFLGTFFNGLNIPAKKSFKNTH